MTNRALAIAIAIVVVVALAFTGAFFWLKSSRIPDDNGMERAYEPQIQSLTYYHGGSSEGDLYRIELKDSSFTVTNCPYNGAETTEETYPADLDLYYQLDEIAENNNIRSWTDLPSAEIEALDAATTSLSIKFTDGTSISISSGDELPDGGWAAIHEIRQVLEDQME